MVSFYVYEHVRNDTAQVFYVGKGCRDRAHSKTGRNAHWKRIVNIAGFSVRKVAEGVNEELAFLVEVELIDQLKRLGVHLCNQTNGGEGASGAKRTKETLAKMSAWQVGRKLPEETKRKLSIARSKRTGMYNHSEETKQKMRDAQRGEKNAMFGKKASAETRAKLSAAGTGRKYPPEFGQQISTRQSGDKNPMFGKHHTEESRWRIGKALTGRLHSDEHKEKIRKAKLGTSSPQKITTCPHCGASGAANNMTRYHFANCRSLTCDRVAGAY